MLYKPLNETKSEIRVLLILPQTSAEDRVECTLVTVSLLDLKSDYSFPSTQHPAARSDERLAAWMKLKAIEAQSSYHPAPQIPPNNCYRFEWGDFATLSYTWGNPQDTEIIVINNVEMSVTTNLAAALRTFRRLGFFKGSFKLWVDAVCINQTDMEERNSQVAMMRDLYTSSWTTLAFLGTEASDSGKALNLLETLADFEVKKTTGRLRDILHVNPAYLGGHGEWLALQRFLQRDYWSRLWIVQEAVLAPSNMLMFAGDDYVTWQQVLDGLTSIHTCLWYVKDACLQHDRKMVCTARGEEHDQVSGVWDTKNLHHIDKGPGRLARKRRSGETITYGDLLEVAYATHCSQSLDRVYGLLAFMNPIIAGQIIVDYRSPPSQLFSSVARLFIIYDNSLEILRHGGQWTQTNTPSWAPDWTWQHHNRDQLSPALPFRADGGLPAEFSFSTDGRSLSVRGVIIDTVNEMCSQSTAEHTDDEEIGSSRESGVFRSAYGTTESTRTALYHTLIGGRAGLMGEEQPAEDREMQILNLPASPELAMETFTKQGWAEFSIQGQRYEQWRDWRRTNDKIHLGDLGCVGDFFEDSIAAQANKDSLWADFVRFKNVASGRRFFITSGGRFAWVPEVIGSGMDMKVLHGDLLCIVFGCSLPLVIRRMEGTYRVLGEGYIQGYMDGDVVKELESGTRQSETLILN